MNSVQLLYENAQKNGIGCKITHSFNELKTEIIITIRFGARVYSESHPFGAPGLSIKQVQNKIATKFLHDSAPQIECDAKILHDSAPQIECDAKIFLQNKIASPIQRIYEYAQKYNLQCVLESSKQNALESSKPNEQKCEITVKFGSLVFSKVYSFGNIGETIKKMKDTYVALILDEYKEELQRECETITHKINDAKIIMSKLTYVQPSPLPPEIKNAEVLFVDCEWDPSNKSTMLYLSVTDGKVITVFDIANKIDETLSLTLSSKTLVGYATNNDNIKMAKHGFTKAFTDIRSDLLAKYPWCGSGIGLSAATALFTGHKFAKDEKTTMSFNGIDPLTEDQCQYCANDVDAVYSLYNHLHKN